MRTFDLFSLTIVLGVFCETVNLLISNVMGNIKRKI